MCSCGRVPLLTNKHKRTKTVPKTATACLYLLVCLILRFVCPSVCLSVCPSVRFAFGVRRVHRTDSDALGTDRRPLFMLKVSYCSCRNAEIAELGHSDCFVPVAIVTGILYSNLRVLSQAPSPDLHLQQNKQPASTTSSQPPPPPPPPPSTKSSRSLYCSWRLVFVVV